MPAYFDTGFSVRKPMWHGEGLVLDDYPTDWEDARKKAGLEWEPALRPIYTERTWPVAELDDRYESETDDEFLSRRRGHTIRQLSELPGGLAEALIIDGDSDPWLLHVPSPDHRAVVRDDTDAVLGVVSDSYQLVPHKVMGEIVEALLDAGAGDVKFETAGACKGGAMVWALAYLDEPYRVAGDDTEHLPFLAVLNSHDGSGACKVVKTQVRVVCWNTWQAASADGNRTGQQFIFRHTSGVMDRIDEAKQALAGLRADVDRWQADAEALFGLPADEVAFHHFLSEFIPEPPAGLISDRVKNNVDKAHRIFTSLYLDSPTTQAHRGTALGLVDTAVEYLDHMRGFRNSDTLMGRTMLRPEPLKAKAALLARQVCS